MKDIIRLTLRLPSELHQKLLNLAKQEKRSLNSQIIYILQKFFEKDKDNG